MSEEKLKTIMNMFGELGHNEQVDLFLDIKAALLKDREARTQRHKSELQFQSENLEMLAKGNEAIIGSLSKLASVE